MTARASREGGARREAAPEHRVPAAPPAVLRLQASAGNTAVTALLRQAYAAPAPVQRLVGACPAPPVAPPGVTPAADPRFAAVKGDLAAKARAARTHRPAGTEVRAAQDAAVAPPDDKEAQAKATQADRMAAAKPAGFDKAAFIAAVNAAVAKQAPKNLEEADGFATSGKADQVKSEVLGKVTQGKDQSGKDIAEKTRQAPDLGAAVDKPVTPLPPGPPPPQLAPPDPRRATPERAPAEQTDLRADQCETHGAMESAGVTDDQLARSGEPEFTDALAAKKEGEQHTATAPAAVRDREAQQLSTTTASADAAGKAAVTGMTGARALSGQKGDAAKAATKTRDEQDRARITGEIKGIFDATKAEVETILSGIDTEVTKRFETGEARAKAAFTADHQARMRRYKDDRYSGIGGDLLWVKDLIADLPAEANALFLESKKLYETQMQAVIADIADYVGVELNRATARIAQGRDQVKRKVADQPVALRKIAGEAAADFGKQFDDLDGAVLEKQQAVVDDLAAKYVEARGAVDEEIKKLQEDNKGLWSKAKDAVGGAIETIGKLKDMLLGVLARAAGAVELIIKDPIGFLGNLVNAVKSGVLNFGANILDHLKAGLKAWLLGNLASAGVEIPETFDLRGILKLVLSLLGLTWANVRSRILKVIPEPVLAALEKTVAVVGILINEGLPGLWKWVLEKIGDIKEMVLGQIKEFVVEKIVKAGLTWIISLLNPAAAFIKACKAIYDIVMFFVDKAAQIKEFVDTVLDSIESIAKGGVGAVAGLIEKTLGKAVPLVIGMLASLLGLGGISEKIKTILDKIAAPVTKVIDSVVGTIVKAGKKIISKIGKRKDKAGGDSQQSAKVKADALNAAANRLKGKQRIEEVKPILADIRREYRPQGLTGLTLKPNSDLSSIELSATASPAETRSISFDEVFAHMGAKEMAELRKVFENKAKEVMGDKAPRNYVIAAITVEGETIGKAEFNEGSGGAHAETVVADNHWPSALDRMRGLVTQRRNATKSGTEYQPPRLVFAISASPCQPCSKKLRTLIGQARGDAVLGAPGAAEFVLAPRAVYEGKMAPEKKTLGKDLVSLVEMGWDLRQLATKATLEPQWERVLAEFANKIHKKVVAAGK